MIQRIVKEKQGGGLNPASGREGKLASKLMPQKASEWATLSPRRSENRGSCWQQPASPLRPASPLSQGPRREGGWQLPTPQGQWSAPTHLQTLWRTGQGKKERRRRTWLLFCILTWTSFHKIKQQMLLKGMTHCRGLLEVGELLKPYS